MATAHFSNIVDVKLEIHEAPELNRTYLHLLIDSRTFQGAIHHEEAVLQWEGDKETILNKLGISIGEKK